MRTSTRWQWISLTLFCLLLTSTTTYAQQRIVRGTVTSEDEGTLPGVNVLIKGSTTGTVTDMDGNYQISVPNDNAVLVFSSIGYTAEEVTVGNQSTINVELVPDIQSLSEVVVVGYGTQEKGVVTGAVSSVDMDQVQSLPLTSVEQTLQGRVPGVQVTQTGGGTPGGAVQVNIRGIGTINGETPLYVIDGVQVQQGQQGPDGYSILNSLNPSDIESIDILKDASAAAIYGSRASGGVVLITTKRGKSGPVKVNLDAYYGMQSQGSFYDVLSGPEYINYLQELHSGPDGQIPLAFDSNADGGGRLLNTDINTNWQDELYNPAPIQKYNVGLSGGNDNAVFSAGFEYFNQEGTMKGTSFDRLALRINSDFKIGKRIKVGESFLLSKTYREVNGGSGGRQPQEHAIKQAPTVSIFDNSFLGGYAHPDTDEGQDARNPIADAALLTNDQDRYQIFGSVYGELEIFKSLTYKLQLGLDFSYQNSLNYNPEFEQVRRLTTFSSITRNRSESINPLVEQTLTYQKSFGEHNLTVLGGWSAQETNYSNISISGQKLPPNVISVEAATENVTVSESDDEVALRSIFGRVSYDYANKYLVTANIRRDESSKLFRGTDPTGIFPSVSAGWRISEEAFMESVPFISDLKVRAGIGEVGNQAPLGPYPTDANLLTNYYYVLGNTPTAGISQSELANRSITWETSRQLDIGVDMGLLDNRIFINFDYYKRNTVDLILRASVPPSVGLGAPFVNAGEVENRGVEMGITYRKSVGDFQFDVNANLTTINNEVIALAGDEDVVLRSGSVTDDINEVSWTQVGESIGTFYGYESEGIFRDWDEVYSHAYINQEVTGTTDANGVPIYDTDARDAETAVDRTAPGDLKWKDQNGDGIVNSEDQVALGSPIPDFLYGLSFNAGYKGFDFQVFLQGSQGGEIYNAAKRWLVDFRQNFNQGAEALNATYYQPEYTASEPRIVRADPNRNVLRSSDRYVYDGSYARIKNLVVGYNFSASVLERINANKLRVYVSAQNLATFTSYYGLEPEVGSRTGDPRSNGIDRLLYPQPRTIIAGIQLGF
ncbi:TonB-dependent receptor [Porifericola rhodea]|uniref:SusC/RagA family TonB-linked outer membrane protein n=1 Tax=Porifericola rhodea TaxID=930972 RepID=UPI0026659824|nr:TonB-dependent receptor [Porifericola rhodea]WKN29916.1 TonB-dependent receptor [Porifericola rhodea]